MSLVNDYSVTLKGYVELPVDGDNNKTAVLEFSYGVVIHKANSAIEAAVMAREIFNEQIGMDKMVEVTHLDIVPSGER